MKNINKDIQEMGRFKDDAFAEKVLDTTKTHSVLTSDERSESKDMELYLKLHIANHRPG